MNYHGILHEYTPGKVAFEFSKEPTKKTVIFIGGLDDGLINVPFVPTVAKHLSTLGWSLMQVQISSSFKGWGLSSLDKDIAELRELVSYLRSKAGGSRDSILLFGHSTGSQDTMHYLLHHGDTIDGGILQASVSDREAYRMTIGDAEKTKLDAGAKELMANGKAYEILPWSYARHVYGTAVTAYRWCSIMLPGGDDDYFSSDLGPDVLSTTFGKLDKPFLIAFSECDEYVPDYVDKKKLLLGWKENSNPKYWSENSGLISGGNHKVVKKTSQEFLSTMIVNFIKEFNF